MIKFKNMACGVCEILDGMISILSFGNYHACLTFKIVAYFELKEIHKRMVKGN